MKKIASVLFIVLTALALKAQQPVKWTTSAKALKDNKFEIRLTAKISEGWYIYSQYMAANGPIPTSISYEKNPQVEALGKAMEVGVLRQKYDSTFGMEIKVFLGQVEFVQQVAVKGNLPVILDGEVMYMGCNAEVCMPPQVEKFKITLK